MFKISLEVFKPSTVEILQRMLLEGLLVCVKLPLFPKDPAEIDEAYLKDFINKLRYVEEKCKIKILKNVLGDGATNYAHRIHDLTRDR